MTFKFTIAPELEKILNKLARKDKALAAAIHKKIQQIIAGNNTFIDHFKNLRGDLSGYKRVHIGRSFVLMFQVKGDTIVFRRFRHHDRAYG